MTFSGPPFGFGISVAFGAFLCLLGALPQAQANPCREHWKDVEVTAFAWGHHHKLVRKPHAALAKDVAIAWQEGKLTRVELAELVLHRFSDVKTASYFSNLISKNDQVISLAERFLYIFGEPGQSSNHSPSSTKALRELRKLVHQHRNRQIGDHAVAAKMEHLLIYKERFSWWNKSTLVSLAKKARLAAQSAEANTLVLKKTETRLESGENGPDLTAITEIRQRLEGGLLSTAQANREALDYIFTEAKRRVDPNLGRLVQRLSARIAIPQENGYLAEIRPILENLIASRGYKTGLSRSQVDELLDLWNQFAETPLRDLYFDPIMLNRFEAIQKILGSKEVLSKNHNDEIVNLDESIGEIFQDYQYLRLGLIDPLKIGDTSFASEAY